VKRVEFLGHIDPVAKGYRVFAPAVSAEDLARQIQPEVEKANLVISHGSSGEYWHPAHLLVFAAAERALKECQDSGWLTFLARQPDHPIPRLVNLDDPVFLSLDVRRHREKRWDALSSHTSQLGLFAKFAGGRPEDCVDLVTTENYCLRRPTNREND
jgi:LmbE family N-acetylglucosaminyl deacetylase